MPTSMELDINGPVHVVDHGGEGRPILLVHGLGGSHVNWSAVAEPLTEFGSVRAIDLIGFGSHPTCRSFFGGRVPMRSRCGVPARTRRHPSRADRQLDGWPDLDARRRGRSRARRFARARRPGTAGCSTPARRQCAQQTRTPAGTWARESGVCVVGRGSREVHGRDVQHRFRRPIAPSARGPRPGACHGPRAHHHAVGRRSLRRRREVDLPDRSSRPHIRPSRRLRSRPRGSSCTATRTASSISLRPAG